jgi:aminoglycoside phosphotransferase (APT) family kinase protein
VLSDLDEDALSRWLKTAAPAVGELISLERFSGGQSNPTYRMRTNRGNFVLRRRPFGQLLASAHSVDRECKLISALHPVGYPVPRPVILCTDEGVIGSVFYIMEMVDGRSFWDGDIPELDPSGRRCVYEAMVDTLARLHSIPIEATGLQAFGRPGNYFARQIERWDRQYRASQNEESPQIDALIEFLRKTVPDQERTTIIHGDYRIDNLIFAEDKINVIAVLDWELSTLGDPMADFTYFALNWVMPNTLSRASIGGLDLPALGIPTLEEITQRYCTASGLARPPQLEWYFAFNLFRTIGIAQGVKKRLLDGTASGDNPGASAQALPHLITSALEFAQRAGAVLA